MEIPAEIKYITPFIQRGQELISRDPIVSYYAQFYAAKLAIARGPRTKETNEYLSHILDSLEKQKTSIGENEAITDDLVGYAHVENFALKIFVNADNEDRAGKASKKTAKTFLAASIFLELLKTFGDIDPEVEAKIKYAKWKATDIMKALREGRTPTAGPPGGEDETFEELQQPENTGDAPDGLPPSISEFPSPPSNFTAPLPPSSPKQQKPDVPSPPPPQQPVIPTTPQPEPEPVHQKPIAAPQVTTTTTTNTSTEEISPQSIAAAQKNCKWAISALDYDDIKTARTQLLSALNELGFNQENNFGF